MTTAQRLLVKKNRRPSFVAMVWVLRLCSVLLPLGVAGSVWYPYLHFYGHYSSPPPAVIAALRNAPNEAVLNEIAHQDAFMMRLPNDATPVETAYQLLDGRFPLRKAAIRVSRHPFAPEDVRRVAGGQQLAFYGFAAPRIYLEAYNRTGNVIFLRAARDFILAWIGDERSRWRPEGLLWNDHAIVQRSHVLIEFWNSYRTSPLFSAGDAGKILGYAMRCGSMLADPALYTFRTNHGVMQNLELLQLGIAFPTVLDFVDYGRLARERLTSQLPHYVDSEGAILEHSAGYHVFGVELLGLILRDFALLGERPPDILEPRYERALTIYAALRRPDGSLPVWGDTENGSKSNGDFVSFGPRGIPGPLEPVGEEFRPSRTATILPQSGFAVLWAGLSGWPDSAQLSQSFLTWSYFPPLGHKHADELSLLLWARGRNWWSSSGYVDLAPFPSEQLVSWDGSNAPHLVGEAFSSARQSHLLAYAVTDDLGLIDVERHNEDGFAVRRQFVRVGSRRWLVIDTVHDPKNRTVRTVWPVDPAIVLSGDPSGRLFQLTDPERQNTLDAFFLGPSTLTTTIVRGSTHPYVGWALTPDHVLAPTSAVLVQQSSSDAWAVNAFEIRQTDQATSDTPLLDKWQDAEHWRLTFPDQRGSLAVERDGGALHVSGQTTHALGIPLTPGPDVTRQISAVLAAYQADRERYGGPVRELWPYRMRAFAALLAIFAAQQIIFIVGRALRLAHRPAIDVGCILAWSGAAMWMWLYYF